MNNRKRTFKLLANSLLFAFIFVYAPLTVSGVVNENTKEQTVTREDPPGPPW